MHHCPFIIQSYIWNSFILILQKENLHCNVYFTKAKCSNALCGGYCKN